MRKAEFDQFADKYDDILSKSIPGGISENPYFAEYKIRLISSLLSTYIPKRILDFGCGPGRSLPYLLKYFPESEIWGFDVSTESLDVAKHKMPDVHFISDLSTVGKNSINMIIAANVFHHIAPEERVLALSKCHKLLTKDGKMFIFEHNPYNPITRWIFEHCPFDEDAEMISRNNLLTLSRKAKFSIKDSGYTLFFPAPLAYLRRYEPMLKFIPLGAQYYVQLGK